MKVNGFQVEEHSSGYHVTIRIQVGKEETVWINDFMTRLQVGGDLFNDAPAADDDALERAKTAAKKGGGKGRRAAQRDAVEKDDDADEKPKAEGRRAAGKGGSKGRRGKDPTGTTRKRGNSSAKGAGGGKGRRSHRAASSTKDQAEDASSPSEVSDEDLTKASSQAAQVIGPPAVITILEEFGVATVGDLEGDQRTEFIERVNEARAEGG